MCDIQKENEAFEVIWAMCTICGKSKKMSFFVGDKYRLTWCMHCGSVVKWIKGESNEEM